MNPHQEVCLSFAVVWAAVEGQGCEGPNHKGDCYAEEKACVQTRPCEVTFTKSEVVKAAFDQEPAGCGGRKTARALITNWPPHRILTAKLFFPPCFT